MRFSLKDLEKGFEKTSNPFSPLDKLLAKYSSNDVSQILYYYASCFVDVLILRSVSHRQDFFRASICGILPTSLTIG